MLDSEKDLLVTTEVTVYRRRWYILTGTANIPTQNKDKCQKPLSLAHCLLLLAMIPQSLYLICLIRDLL